MNARHMMDLTLFLLGDCREKADRVAMDAFDAITRPARRSLLPDDRVQTYEVSGCGRGTPCTNRKSSLSARDWLAGPLHCLWP
ncbi:hypothetical protein PSP6_370077 [Paraburkholderia tropica]|nr:hypothetical protein PSP6_370077 [Paraburkholderia tropica]